jgi:hypothetical protein
MHGIIRHKLNEEKIFSFHPLNYLYYIKFG